MNILLNIISNIFQHQELSLFYIASDESSNEDYYFAKRRLNLYCLKYLILRRYLHTSYWKRINSSINFSGTSPSINPCNEINDPRNKLNNFFIVAEVRSLHRISQTDDLQHLLKCQPQFVSNFYFIVFFCQ